MRYQKEIERLEKENRDLRREIILKRKKDGGKKRRMRVCIALEEVRKNCCRKGKTLVGPKSRSKICLQDFFQCINGQLLQDGSVFS